MEDLQSLLEKINRDGIEKADAEAKRIVAEAEAKAAEIVKAARAEAAKAKAEAEQASADYAARAAETVRQAERDTLLKIEAAVTRLLEQLLVKDVNAALAEPASVAKLTSEVIGALTTQGEVTVATSAALAKTLVAQLADAGKFTVVTDDFQGTGFTVKLDGGRVEHSFTGETIAAELAKRLRPDLAALLK